MHSWKVLCDLSHQQYLCAGLLSPLGFCWDPGGSGEAGGGQGGPQNVKGDDPSVESAASCLAPSYKAVSGSLCRLSEVTIESVVACVAHGRCSESTPSLSAISLPPYEAQANGIGSIFPASLGSQAQLLWDECHIKNSMCLFFQIVWPSYMATMIWATKSRFPYVSKTVSKSERSTN